MRGSINRAWNRTVGRSCEAGNKGSLRGSYEFSRATSLPIPVEEVSLSPIPRSVSPRKYTSPRPHTFIYADIQLL